VAGTIASENPDKYLRVEYSHATAYMARNSDKTNNPFTTTHITRKSR
jgi:hypothetical protein